MPTELSTRSTRDSHLEAAKLLVLTSISEDAWATLVHTMTEAVVTSNQQVRRLRPAFDLFFKQYLTRAELAVRLAPLYVERFTELELRQMIWFYSTDAGKKALVEMPGLMQAGGAIGQRIVEEHQADLQRILAEYVAAHPEAAPETPR